MKSVFIPVLFLLIGQAYAQPGIDSSVLIGKKVITLREVVVDRNLNVPAFIRRIQTDSSFYKAFKNLRVLGFSAWNDIRMLDKEGGLKASLRSKTRQERKNGCRSMQVIEQETSGDIYDEDSSFNYYTAEMYASLFFTKGLVCGENNIIGAKDFHTSGLSGLEKHKQQLKMLFFSPGRKISGIPFMSGKTAIYDDHMADRYDFDMDMEEHGGQSCFVFKQKVRPGREDAVVIDEMETWFNDSTFDVVARKWHLSYEAGLYDFDVNMEVEMGKYQDMLVPVLIRYTGNWKALFKKRERGVFTATLFDFIKSD